MRHFLENQILKIRGFFRLNYLTKNWDKNKNKYKTKKPIVIIHSMNTEGASIMENYLKGVSLITKRIPIKLILTG